MPGDSLKAVHTPNRNRFLVLAAVAGVHVVVIGVLLSRIHSISRSSPTVIPLTAFILMRPAHPRSPYPRPRLHKTYGPPLPGHIVVAAPTLPAMMPGAPSVDWRGQMSSAAAKVLKPGGHVSFGFPPGGQSAITMGVPSRSSPHYAGESYTTVGGEKIYWVSGHCYLVSDPPSLFEPDFLNNARTTRVGCQ
jgi:hypothetical protein